MSAEKPNLPSHGRAPRFLVGTLGVGGLAMLALGFWLLIPALRSANWPAVQGVITGHRIESMYLSRAMNYEVGVDYVYEVAHARHTGRVFSHVSTSLPMSFRSREAAEAAYASGPEFTALQVGHGVTVYFDPQEPADSVLQKGSSQLATALCLLGAGLLGAAAWEGRKIRAQAATS